MGKVVTKAAAAVRAQPEANAPTTTQVPGNTSLGWLDGQREGGFLRVLPPRGPVGWVAEDQVQIVQQPPAADVTEAAAAPCKATLGACTAIGCAAAGSPHAVFNQAKQRIPPATGAVVPIDFADLHKLQQQAEALVGSGAELTAAQRAKLKNLTVKQGKVNEGSRVQLAGFPATGPLKPHPNTGESVNCGLKKPEDNDFHISVVPAKDGTEFTGVVVELIPQHRNAAWTIPHLNDIQAKRQRVLITGGLFYDNEHTVNDDPKHELSGQPRRISLWEVHPITALLVCEKADQSCKPETPGDWTALPVFTSH